MLKSNFFHLYLFPLGRQCNPQLRIYLSDLTQINLKMHSRGRSGSLIPISWSLGGEDSLGGPVFWCQGVVKDLRLSLGRNISHGQSPPGQCPFSSWERKGNVQIFWQHNIKIQHPGIQLVMKTEWKMLSTYVHKILRDFFIGVRCSSNNSSIFGNSSTTCIWHVYWANVSWELATIIALPHPILP